MLHISYFEYLIGYSNTNCRQIIGYKSVLMSMGVICDEEESCHSFCFKKARKKIIVTVN